MYVLRIKVLLFFFSVSCLFSFIDSESLSKSLLKKMYFLLTLWKDEGAVFEKKNDCIF